MLDRWPLIRWFSSLGLAVVIVGVNSALGAQTDLFDHSYRTYARLLRTHVVHDRVDYATMLRNRETLDAVVKELGQVTTTDLSSWTLDQQVAYWINSYNVFTLQAIVDHYPIKASWFSLPPRNSIKQIDGVWTQLRWKVGGTSLTLNEIEHETLRKKHDEPRMHFAINCASVSCPPLRPEPYVANRLERQLILATSEYLASDAGLQIDGSTLRVSKIFSWYIEDFIDHYARLMNLDRPKKDRAILGVIAKYGPREASTLAQSGTAQIRFLQYDWSLNETTAH